MPSPPEIPLQETDKMNLLAMLGDLHDRKLLKEKIQGMIEEFLIHKTLTLNGERMLILLHALLFLVKDDSKQPV